MTKEELKPIDTSKYKITETGQVLKMTKDEMKDEIKNRLLEDIFMSYLKKIPEDLKLGEEREVTCVCGGKLFISKSRLNGHVHLICNKCKFQLMQ